MHTHTHNQQHQRQAQEIAHLLDPCYHIEPSHTKSSPCSSMHSTHAHTTWRDATGKHDPDFRPFVTTFPTFPPSPSPRRSSLDAPLSPTAAAPSKAERAAARSELHPALREALVAHERQLAREQRRPAWLKRHRKNSDSIDYVEEVQDRDDVPSSPSLHLPELVSDDGSDDDELDDDADADEKHTPHPHPHREQLKQQLASLTLRVDLAVFRAKKRLRRRVGLE